MVKDEPTSLFGLGVEAVIMTAIYLVLWFIFNKVDRLKAYTKNYPLMFVLSHLPPLVTALIDSPTITDILNKCLILAYVVFVAYLVHWMLKLTPSKLKVQIDRYHPVLIFVMYYLAWLPQRKYDLDELISIPLGYDVHQNKSFIRSLGNMLKTKKPDSSEQQASTSTQ